MSYIKLIFSLHFRIDLPVNYAAYNDNDDIMNAPLNLSLNGNSKYTFASFFILNNANRIKGNLLFELFSAENARRIQRQNKHEFVVTKFGRKIHVPLI